MNIWSGSIALNGETQLEGNTLSRDTRIQRGQQQQQQQQQRLTQIRSRLRSPANRPDLTLALRHSQRFDAALPVLRQPGAGPAVRARRAEPGTAHDGGIDGGMAEEQTGGQRVAGRGGSRAVSVRAVSRWDFGGC